MDNKKQIGSGMNNMGMGMGMGMGRLRGKTADKMMASRSKELELKMKEQAESDIDLGYVGSYSRMRCSELKPLFERLQCNYEKYSFKDPEAENNAKRKETLHFVVL